MAAEGGELDCRLRLQWEPFGSISCDLTGKLLFPRVPAKPGLYQFDILGPNARRASYVGETDNVQRRFAHYRNPGPTQATNLRLNALLQKLLVQGASIELQLVLATAWISWENVEAPADLSRKSMRRMFENMVLGAERAAEVESLNR